MIFVSLSFLIFLFTTFFIYWILPFGYRKIFLFLSSCFFYVWWDWRFLFLLLSYGIIDFFIGKRIYSTENPHTRRKYLISSIFLGILLLGFFKYFNFFVESLKESLLFLGISEISFSSFDIILPLGISFFIFKSMSYNIDIYRKALKPANNMLDFMTFLIFFPQIASGPIERAIDFLPQLERKKVFEYKLTADGFRQILWGFFKKIVIADSLAIVVNRTFLNPGLFSGGDLFLALIFFAFQIYADFSGYSDIAIGSSKLFGFTPKPNFNYPYFSTSITEFWRKWHISLSSWLRDYVYYPLIFRSKSKNKTVICLSIIITFVIVGFWHGAGWNFIIMGFIFGLYMVIELLIQNFKK